MTHTAGTSSPTGQHFKFAYYCANGMTDTLTELSGELSDHDGVGPPNAFREYRV